jgi:hypothetical protein
MSDRQTTISSVSYRFSSDDWQLKTVIGIREPGAILIPPANGVALYGPYIDLPAGHYEAVIQFDPARPCYGEARMDVSADIGRDQLSEQRITADQIRANGMSARLDFVCSRPLRAVEVRMAVKGGFSGRIVAVEISGEPQWQPVGIADLPQPNIENAMRRGRNLYEGYQRGIGLGFANLGSRIAMDPDFHRARSLAGSRTIIGDSSLANIFLLIKFFLPRLAFGHIVEFGSYKGGSAIFMAALAEKFLPGVEVIGFDTFSGMPSTDRAVDAHDAGSFADVDLAELRRYVGWTGLSNLTFVQGYFEESAAAVLQQRASVAFCHIDCDIRSAVAYAYETTRPYMVPGGYWVFDDPFAADCLGAAEAVEDLLIRRDGLNSEQLSPHYVFRQWPEVTPPSPLTRV